MTTMGYLESGRSEKIKRNYSGKIGTEKDLLGQFITIVLSICVNDYLANLVLLPLLFGNLKL